MIFLAHPQEATEAHDCKHDVIGQLVKNDVLDLANLLAGQILDARSENLLRTNRVGACSAYAHDMTLLCGCGTHRKNESAGAMFHPEVISAGTDSATRRCLTRISARSRAPSARNSTFAKTAAGCARRALRELRSCVP